MKRRDLKPCHPVLRSQHQRGLTLIEVLVSLVLVMLVSSMTLAVIPMSKINRDVNTDQTFTLAVKQYFEAISNDWKTQANFDKGTQGLTTSGATLTSGSYTCNRNVTDPDNMTSGTPLRRRVVLTCTSTGKPTQVFATEYGRPSS